MGDEQRVAAGVVERARAAAVDRGRPRPSGRQRCHSSSLTDRGDGERVAVAAEAGDDAGGHRCDHRRVAPLLAGGRVREVELDDRAVEGGQRVLDRPAVVREGGGVDDDRRAAAPRPLHGLHQVALVVRLEVLEREAVGLGDGARRRHVVVEGGRAVDLGLALPSRLRLGPLSSSTIRSLT